MAVLFMWMDAWIHWAKYLGYEWYSRIRWIVVQVFSILALLIVLVWLSVFMYASFYYTYMPAVTHTRDIHLQFRTDCETNRQSLRPELCSFPFANLSLSRDGSTEILMRGQPYVVVIMLDMPESPTNQNQGMFMVRLDLHSKHGHIVRSSLRSALLLYKSWLYQMLETFYHLPMLLMGMSVQKQQLAVTFFDTHEEDPYNPTLGAYVEIQTKSIEIYSATLKIHAKFVGLRYLLYHWPIVSALFGIGTVMFFLAMLTVLSWYKFGADISGEIVRGSTKLTLEERRSRIRAILDRERRGRSRSRSGSTTSFPGIAATGMHHSYSQPNLTHRRSNSASFSQPPRVDTLSHSVSTSNIEALSQQSQFSARRHNISQESLNTTDFEDEDLGEESEKAYSTPGSSGSSSQKSDPLGLGIELRQRKPTTES